MPGPPGKRDAERRRVNPPVIPTITVDVAKLASREVEIPEPNPDWHQAAYDWYMSMASSGQSYYFEDSDWMVAYVVAEDLSRQLNPIAIVISDSEGNQRIVEKEVPMNGAKLTAFIKAAGNLMATEYERRRLKMEIERGRKGPDEGLPEGVTDILSRRREALEA